MARTQKRIEFIDLAKGVCIILVVLGHCGAPIPIPGLEIVRMPLYFILSGLFFKDYGGGYNFFIKKTNKKNNKYANRTPKVRGNKIARTRSPKRYDNCY